VAERAIGNEVLPDRIRKEEGNRKRTGTKTDGAQTLHGTKTTPGGDSSGKTSTKRGQRSEVLKGTSRRLLDVLGHHRELSAALETWGSLLML